MAPGVGVGPALNGTQRVFYALWPDAEVRSALAQTSRRMHGVLQGRRTRDDSIHLTLAFLGEVNVDRLPVLLAPPQDLFPAAFTLALDEWGCWSRNGIGWAGPSHTPAGLRDLVANLQAWLRVAGFDLERRAFLPHVTLIRKAQCATLPALGPQVSWPVGECVLVRSTRARTGSCYEVIGRWPLSRN